MKNEYAKSVGRFLLLGAALMSLRVGLKTYADYRAITTYEEHAKPLSSIESIRTFEEEKNKLNLQNVNIELVLLENFNDRGLTKKIKSGYRVTLKEPSSKLVIRHELSHVKDFKEDRLYLSTFMTFPSWFASEIRAQNYSIKE